MKDRLAMKQPPIPNPVIAVLADVLATHYTHTRLNLLFQECGAPGEPPEGNKEDKCAAWLKRLNHTAGIEASSILGAILENFMEVDQTYMGQENTTQVSNRRRVTDILSRHGLRYEVGGRIYGAAAASPTRSLEAILRARDLAAVHKEFERALQSVEQDPPAAITAACAIVEALCKTYCEDEGVDLPKEQSIKPLWKAVQSHIGFDPAKIEDDDLKRILTGLASIVDGIGSFRTHAGSAHGRGPKSYRPAPRHARLLLHSAHSLVAFCIETWDARRARVAV
jgi:hypothetical protein